MTHSEASAILSPVADGSFSIDTESWFRDGRIVCDEVEWKIWLDSKSLSVEGSTLEEAVGNAMRILEHPISNSTAADVDASLATVTTLKE